MATTPEIPQVELAHFKTLTGSPRVEFDVHFNPESLEYAVTNTLKEEGKGGNKKQFVDKTTAKLTMQLDQERIATKVGLLVVATVQFTCRVRVPYRPLGCEQRPTALKSLLDKFASDLTDQLVISRRDDHLAVTHASASSRAA